MDRKKLGARLRALREKKGATVYLITKAGNIRYDQVRAIESGNRNYTIDALLGYLIGLDLKFSDLSEDE